MSLKIKFFIPVFALISIVMAVAIAFSHKGTKDTIESLLYKQIELQADTTEVLVSSWIKRNVTDLEIISRSNDIKSLFKAGLSQNQYKYAYDKLSSVTRAHKFYEVISVLSSKGDPLLTTLNGKKKINTFDRDYFQKSLKGNTIISDILYSKYTNKPVFVISVPVYNNNRVQGVLIGVIKITNFVKSFIDKVKIGKLGRAYIYDSNGLTLSFEDKSKLINIEKEEIALGKLLQKKNLGLFQYGGEKNAPSKIAVLKRIRNTGWGIAITAVEKEFLEALNKHREFNIVISFLMAVILGTGIWFMVLGFVIQPIGKIVNHIRDIDVDKDTLKKVIPVRSNDEIGELTRTLNQMAKKLNQAMFNLKNEVLEKKLAEEALMSERDNSSNIIYNSPNVICEIAPDGSTIFINPTGLRLTGYTKREILGRNWWQILSAENEVKKFENLLKLYEKQNIYDYEMPINSRDGQIYTISWTFIKKYNEAGEFISTMGIGNDISRRKVVEKELQKAHDELEKRVHERTRELVLANEKASESASAKSEFLANMSHEIRTPMNAIIGMCDLVLDTNLSRKQNNFIKIIRSSSRSLLELINDILDFSKIDAGKLVFETIKFNLRDIIEEATDMYLDKSLEKDIELIVDIDPEVPREVYTDPLRLRQVLVNLLTNAFKFTSEGEICISVKKKSHKDNNAEIEFCVSDTGIGIKEELSKKLFDVFAQADGSTTREYGGTGLGLAICKKIVDQMSGNIWIESEFGVGSSFFFTVDLKVAYGDQVVINKAPNELNKLNVLIVEDNPSTMMVLKRFIESFGFQSSMAKSGEDAIEMFNKEPEFTFGLILMDVKLPGIDGFSTSKIIKRSSKKSPPVIAISTLMNNIEKAKQVGIESTLIKPIKQSLLFDTIMQILGYDTNPAPKEEKELFKSNEFNNTKVLLVEDNVINQMVASEILLSAGISVDKASTGLQAIEMVQEHKDYDAILMDVQMPEMDGIEATKIIRNKMKRKNIPIIAMTAHAMYGDKERCFDAGMDDYVPKPIDQKELFKALRKNIFRFDHEIEKIDEKPEQNKDSEFPGLNVKEGIERLGGNKEIYSEIVDEFCNTFNTFAEEFESCISQKVFSDAKLHVHSLKGAAGNISADGLFHTAKLLEKACISENTEDIFTILPEVDDHIKNIRCSSKKLYNEKVQDVSGSDNNEIMDIVKNLSKSLDESDPIESEANLSKFKSYVLHNVYDTELLLLEKKLVVSVNNYEFDKAKDHLIDFSKSLKNV